MHTLEEIKYQEAKKRVKKLKGFYTHAAIYVIVNIFIVFINCNNLAENESYFQFKNFITAFFWGIGLLSHALSVFLPNWIMGENWEEKKIMEFMEKEKENKKTWQ